MDTRHATVSRRYLVELPIGVGTDDVAAVAARARTVSRGDVTAGVRFLRAIAVPDDALWLLLYEAPSRASVAAAVRRLGLRAASISAALDEDAITSRR